MTTKELIDQYVTAHADNRWMDASELETLLTEFAEKLKEPASEDLKQAAEEYSGKKQDHLNNAFIAGAQWQKEQFEKNRLIACDKQTKEEAEVESDFVMGIIENEHRQPTFDDAIKYGMRLQREQMMKDAVEADIAESFTPVSESPNIYMHGFTCVYEEKKSTPYVVAPCKVKLIIIKE